VVRTAAAIAYLELDGQDTPAGVPE